jgi:superfamily II DNA or RNA helicase
MNLQKIYNRLYPYQKEAIKSLKNKKGRALLSLNMGLGKTVAVLAYVS